MAERKRDGCSPLPDPLSRVVQKVDSFFNPEARYERIIIGNLENNPTIYTPEVIWDLFLLPKNVPLLPERLQSKVIEILLKPQKAGKSGLGAGRTYRYDPVPSYVRENIAPFQADTMATLLPKELTGLRNRYNKKGGIYEANMIEYYNNLIIDLLPLLPPEIGQLLFESFDIRDVEAFDDEDYSGYAPLEKLLTNPAVPEKIKLDGIAKIHYRTAVECRRESQPRVEAERASMCHRRMIEKLISKPKMPVSAYVIETMVSLLSCADTHKPVVEVKLTEKALQYIREPMNRIHFIEQQLPHFKIMSEEQAIFATRLFREFRDIPEISGRLALELNAWEKRKSSGVS